MEPKLGYVPMAGNSIFGPACRTGGILVVAEAPGPAWTQWFQFPNQSGPAFAYA